MSSQKGNASRSRPQKYQNSHAFKNTLHDTSHKTKFINNIQVVNVCERCKKIIEWKIKYKKYKPLKAPSKCTKCYEKCVKHAYHIMCGPCAQQHKVCPKCGEKEEIIRPEPEEQPVQLDRELRLMLKKLPERKRRTFLRYMKRNAAGKDKTDNPETSKDEKNTECGEDNKESNSKYETVTTEEGPLTRDDLLKKLQSLLIATEQDDDFYGVHGFDDSDVDGENFSDESSECSNTDDDDLVSSDSDNETDKNKL